MRSIQQLAGRMGSGEQAAQQLLEGHRWNTLAAAKAHSESSAGGQQQPHLARLPAFLLACRCVLQAGRNTCIRA